MPPPHEAAVRTTFHIVSSNGNNGSANKEKASAKSRAGAEVLCCLLRALMMWDGSRERAVIGVAVETIVPVRVYYAGDKSHSSDVSRYARPSDADGSSGPISRDSILIIADARIANHQLYSR